jgi:hypothetical protein
MLYMFDNVAGRIPLRTLEVVWTAPVVEQLGLYDRLSPGGSSPALQDLLAQKANPEFNNPCGLCDPFLDWGAAEGWSGGRWPDYCWGSPTERSATAASTWSSAVPAAGHRAVRGASVPVLDAGSTRPCSGGAGTDRLVGDRATAQRAPFEWKDMLRV